MDEMNFAQAMADYLDSVDQPYNFVYLMNKAEEMIQDFDAGIAQDPDYE
jgi:hypothetical protein